MIVHKALGPLGGPNEPFWMPAKRPACNMSKNNANTETKQNIILEYTERLQQYTCQISPLAAGIMEATC